MTATEQYVPPPIDPRKIVRSAFEILLRRRSQMFLFFFGTMALVVVGLLICPREYESEAKLFVRVGKENIGIDPTATTGQTMALQESRENEITSVLDILESRIVLEGVVDHLGPRLILDGVEGTQPDGKDLLLREKAIRHLNATVKTSRTKKSNVLGITYRDRSPELAQQILQTFVDQFQTVHIQANRTSGSFEFFDDQATLLRTQFEEASNELNEAKNSINAVSIEQRRTALQSHLSAVEVDMLTSQAELDAVNGSLDELRRTLASLPKKSLTQEVTGFPDDAIGTTRKRIYELEIQEQELLTKYTERHPQILTLRRQLEAARGLLADSNESGSQETSADNPAYQKLQLTKLEQETHAAGLTARLQSLQRQYTQIKKQLEELNAGETQIVELQQRVDLFRDKYTAYSDKFEQARIDQALEAEKISNVNLVQPPSYVAKAVSPRKGLTLVAAFLFGCVGAVCFAFLAEYWQQPETDTSLATSSGDRRPVESSAKPADQPVADAVSEVEQLVETARY